MKKNLLKKTRIISVGGMTEDVFCSIDDTRLVDNPRSSGTKKLLAFEYGGKVGISELRICCGGGAANAAVAFARLGFSSSIIGDAGEDDRGRRILTNLRNNGVDTRLVSLHRQAQSGVSYILVTPNREHVVFTYRGANAISVLSPAEASAVRSAAWTYVTSLSGNWKKVLKPLFASAANVAWNPGREQIAAGLTALSPFLKKTTVLIVNRAEASALVASGKVKASLKNDMRSLLVALRSAGPLAVVITDGEHGAEAYDGYDFYKQPARRVPVTVNTTGVGDAFGSSFIAGLEMYNNNIAKALVLAADNAARVVRGHGAQDGLRKA